MNPAGGKDPDFGHTGNGGKREGMPGTAPDIYPEGKHLPPVKVRRLQNRLWAAAKQSSSRRFHALYDRIYRSDVLWEAWERVRANRGAAGVDGVTLAVVEAYGVERMIAELQESLRSGIYRPSPVRRVEIPKPDGSKRPLGIPTVKDRVCQQAAKIVLEPISEADFLSCSFGFRPKRSATDAMERIRVGFIEGKCLVFEADIRNFLESSTHCSFRCWSWLEQLVLGCGRLDTQAFSASAAYVDGAQLSALYTLHDRLARHAVGEGRLKHGEPSRRCVVDEERADLFGEPDAPRRAGGDLFASDEPVAEPAMQRRWSEADVFCGLLDREQLSFLGIRGGKRDARYGSVAERLGRWFGADGSRCLRSCHRGSTPPGGAPARRSV
jgi:hypothetical protein